MVSNENSEDYYDELAHQWEAEGFFARDQQGQLIRVDKATEKEYREIVTLTIDGHEVAIERAMPLKDSQGDIVNDSTGRTVPRRSTILDAVVKLYQNQFPNDPLPVPTLCHADHLRPVGVCRVCSVAVARLEEDRRQPGKFREITSDKLVPACVQPVEPGMIVDTMRSTNSEPRAARVRNAVKLLLELLAADHLPDNATAAKVLDPAHASDLQRLIARLAPQVELHPERFKPKSPWDSPSDRSSSLIAIDHDACILCDRCSRACNEVKHNYVIGRNGKGYSTRIGFDLSDPMGKSSCVSCGECMLSCPTNALTFLSPIESDWYQDSLRQSAKSAVTAEEMESHPLLGALPFRFRQWNQSSIVRWRVSAGDELCRLGEYGATAFLLNAGEFEIFPRDPRSGQTRIVGTVDRARAMLKRMFRSEPEDIGKPAAIAGPEDRVLGEMTCLNSYPRTATIRARTDGEVFEVRRNVLYALQRNLRSREILDVVYRERSLRRHLDEVSFFAPLSASEKEECRLFLADIVTLLHVDPGQVIFRQDEPPTHFYMIRHGYVKISQTVAGQERILNYLGPNRHFGEIGLISDPAMPESAATPSRRTATCTALDTVELVSVPRDAFVELVRRFPALLQHFSQISRQLRQTDQQSELLLRRNQQYWDFTERGLFNGQKLLVLDLDACTRCDECAKACADTHQGVTRLIRDGLRFDKWLVASACRSCSDPYCLVGCPVDAIHRFGERQEITIENHCIGCGLCANNCPYGSINMHGVAEERPDPANPHRRIAVLQQKATTCDLCHNVAGPGEEVSCVHACPHNAAFRLSGQELLTRIEQAHGP